MQQDRPPDIKLSDDSNHHSITMKESHTMQLTRSLTKKIKRRLTLPRSPSSMADVPSALTSPSSRHSNPASEAGSSTSEQMLFDYTGFEIDTRRRALSTSQRSTRSMNSSSTSVHQLDDSYAYHSGHDTLPRALTSTASSLPSTPRIMQDSSFFDHNSLRSYSPFAAPEQETAFTSSSHDHPAQDQDDIADEMANEILEKVNNKFGASSKDEIWWGL
ncbi:hypothetical protein V1512DRAFT_266728 [Lipomyces arxii]|uniref:uncharacterized protein n=1 Tax=Lipomyces arxii TaxID=56418 RepID=UPI0034CFC939